MKRRVFKWGLRWEQTNRLDGHRQWIMWENCLPLVFQTRKEARAWADKNYGYIKTRKDLRIEPHGWRFPRAVRIEVILKEVKSKR